MLRSAEDAMRSIGVVAFVLALLVPVHASALDAAVRDIVASPERFDGRSVSLRGAVTNLQQTVSGKGNPYFTFDLSDGVSAVRVFSFGRTSCQAGGQAVVDGRFERVKKVGRLTFHDEVTATRVACP
jgi:hypothetical protein